MAKRRTPPPKREYKLLGQFELTSPKLRVTDPCYDRDTWCCGVIDGMQPGIYNAYSAEINDSFWGRRVQMLLVQHKDAQLDTKLADQVYDDEAAELIRWSDLWEHLDIDVGVDSGQCGLFDDVRFKDPISLLPRSVEVCRLENLASAGDADAKAKLQELLNKQLEDVTRYGKDDDGWYSTCCNLTLSEAAGGVIPFGAVTSSGVGDGSYDAFVLRNSQGIGLMVCVLYM